jgi:hypothetical protein
VIFLGLLLLAEASDTQFSLSFKAQSLTYGNGPKSRLQPG